MGIQTDVQKRFKSDIKDHKCTVLKVSGVDRHIRFRKPGTIVRGFDLITWPGHLCISGDCGTYVFYRIYDMFEFFFDGASRYNQINPRYWHEKLLSQDKHGGVKEFSVDKFNKAVHRCFVDSVKYKDYTPIQVREWWAYIRNHIFDPGNEYDAYQSVYNYSGSGCFFDNFFEYDCTEYTWSYLWCLCAIVWGIEQYEYQVMDALRDMNCG